MIGESGVGKSKLFIRFLRDDYRPGSKVRLYLEKCAMFLMPQATIGVDFGSKQITLGGQNVTAQIWDTGTFLSPDFCANDCTAGQERFRALSSMFVLHIYITYV